MQRIELGSAVLYHGACLEILRGMPDNSVDSIVTDPPYGLGKEPDALAMLTDWITAGHHDVKGRGFMGKEWDAFVPQPSVWAECLRVVKPGGHLLSFAGTRTYDLVVLGLRIAGWEIRDQIEWVYGSGFPKSLDVSKAIDAAAGAEREVVGRYIAPDGKPRGVDKGIQGGKFAAGQSNYEAEKFVTAPATDAARQWDGWGTALKPAHEPIVVARKPLTGTVAANVLAWGTGGLNIDGCRVGGEPSPSAAYRARGKAPSSCKPGEYGDTIQNRITPERWCAPRSGEQLGRFPANLIHDGSPEVLACFPDAPGQQGRVTGGEPSTAATNVYGTYGRVPSAEPRTEPSTSAARFFQCCPFAPEDFDPLFYCAKASKSDRGEGNTHPTVKPLALMRYLCRLVTPPGGVVLDNYAGSGTTGCAAIKEGFQPVLIEEESDSFDIACGRVAMAVMETHL